MDSSAPSSVHVASGRRGTEDKGQTLDFSQSLLHFSVPLHLSISLNRLSKIFTCSSRRAVLSAALESLEVPTPSRMQMDTRTVNLMAMVSVLTLWSLRISPKQTKAMLTFSSHRACLRVEATNRKARESSQ